MRTESEKQELARKLVRREIFYCVSSLVSTLSDMARHDNRNWLDQDIHWEEDIAPLMEWVDYEEAGTQAINECEDLTTLEAMADTVGYWSEALNSTEYNEEEEYDDGEGERRTLSFDEWFELQGSGGAIRAVDVLHKYVIDNCTDWKEFCESNDVDTDDFHNEVYEHWIISDWLQRKLAAKGQVTGDLCGLTIWGRCTTGQSICLDRVMQDIAEELWPEGEEA